jgi:biopolymer transport protein ExbD
MSLRDFNQFRSSTKSGSFNMTPLIDIVFLLIIFFLVVCQFIEAENFPVTVPDDCDFAQNGSDPGTPVTTVTVMKASVGRTAFAVGPEKVPASEGSDLIEKIAQLVDFGLRNLPSGRRIVTLRVDRDICFSEAQYALAAIAQSSATDIQLAVLKKREPSNGER